MIGRKGQSKERTGEPEKEKADSAPTGNSRFLLIPTSSLLWSLAPAFLGAVGVIVLMSALFHFLVVDVMRNEGMHSVGETHAKSFAMLVKLNIEAQQSALDVMAKSPAMVAQLAQGGPIDHTQVKQQLAASVKQIRAAYVIGKGQIKTDSDVEPPIGFAAVEMLRRLERGEAVYPEVLTYRKQQILAMVQPIYDQQARYLGGLLVYSNFKAFAEHLSNMEYIVDSGVGSIVLIQKIGRNGEKIISQWGPVAAIGGSGPAFHQAISGTYWKVALSPYIQVVGGQKSAPMLMVVSTLGLILILACIMVTYFMLKNMLHYNARIFLGFCQGLFIKNEKVMPNFTLKIFCSMAHTLSYIRQDVDSLVTEYGHLVGERSESGA